MKLSQLKQTLQSLNEVLFTLPNGEQIPSHFHVTEVGQTTKHFIDCGGTVRHEKLINFQLWYSQDFDHRLAPEKLKSIIELSERTLNIEDAEIEVEYQTTTIGKYGIEFTDGKFVLTNTQTACLASDSCGVPTQKQKINLKELSSVSNACCTPGGGCC